MTAIETLADIISNGFPENASDQTTNSWKDALDKIFGERYRSDSQRDKRVVLTTSEDYIPFAGLLPFNSP